MNMQSAEDLFSFLITSTINIYKCTVHTFYCFEVAIQQLVVHGSSSQCVKTVYNLLCTFPSLLALQTTREWQGKCWQRLVPTLEVRISVGFEATSKLNVYWESSHYLITFIIVVTLVVIIIILTYFCNFFRLFVNSDLVSFHHFSTPPFLRLPCPRRASVLL